MWSLPAKMAAFFGGLHFIGFVVFAGLMLRSAFGPGAAQWQMGWFSLTIIDFPVSLLMFLDIWPSATITWLPYEISNVRWFIVPCIVFGLIGTLWYATLGGVIGWVIEAFMRFAARRKQSSGPGSHSVG